MSALEEMVRHVQSQFRVVLLQQLQENPVDQVGIEVASERASRLCVCVCVIMIPIRICMCLLVCVWNHHHPDHPDHHHHEQQQTTTTLTTIRHLFLNAYYLLNRLRKQEAKQAWLHLLRRKIGESERLLADIHQAVHGDDHHDDGDHHDDSVPGEAAEEAAGEM